MKKIASALLFLFAINFSVKAQCPTGPIPMLGQDTNSVFNTTGFTAVNNIPSSFACSATAFIVYPNFNSCATNACLYSPCIRTRYNPYYTNWRNNVTENFYEGGVLVYDLKPTNAAARRIGGSTPPVNGLGIWDFSLFNLDAAQTHSVSICKTGGGAISTDSVSIRDCWSNTDPPVAPNWTNNPSFTGASPCLTLSPPNLGVGVFSISPVATLPAFYDYGAGYAYVDPRYLSPATYTVTYVFTPPSTSGCAAVTGTYVFTVTSPTVNPNWNNIPNQCTAGACVNLNPQVTGTSGGGWSGTGVTGSQFCPGTSGAGSFAVTYSVGISAQCQNSQTHTVTVNANPTLTITPTSTAICNGQSTLLAGSGATTFTWSANAGSVQTSTANVTPSVGTNVYTLTGTTSGCNGTATATVTVNALPTVTATASSATICSTQSATLTAGGATTFTWSANEGGSSNNPTSITPAATDTYTVTGTDNNGCVNTAQVTVGVTPTPTLTATASPTTICAGQTATLSISGASTYTWDANAANSTASSVNVTPANSTTYSVIGDAGGCTATTTVAVDVTPLPSLTVTPNPASVCPGQTSTLTASGATTFTWSANAGGGNANPVTVTPAGNTTYTLSGTQNGCTDSTTVSVSITPLPSLTVTANPTSVCPGQTSTITASGATTFTWSANAGGGNTNPVTVSPLINTTYTVAGTQNGCTDSTTVTVNMATAPVLSISATDTTICAGQTTTLTASGATNYTWTPGTTGTTSSQSPVTTTTVSLIGDSNGCSDTITFVINVNATPTVSAVASPTAICAGDTAMLTASGANTFTWSASAGSATTSTVNVTPSNTTTYVVTGEDNNGCTSTGQVAVNVTAKPVVIALANPPSVCAGSQVGLVANGTAATYSWSTGATTQITTATPTVNPTTYTVTGFSGSCSSFTTVTVAVVAQPTVSPITVTSLTTCSGAPDTLSVTVSPGSATISWSPGGANTTSVAVTPNITTTYTVLASIGTCTAQSVATITVTPTPQFTATTSGSLQAVCSGGTVQGITLTTNSGTTVDWTNTNSNIGILGSGTGNISTYTAPVTTTSQTGVITATAMNNGCVGNSQSFTVTINPNPVITGTVVPDSSTCGLPNGSLTGLSASGGTGALTYNWTMGGASVGSSANLTNMLGGSYLLTVTDANMCQAQSGPYTIDASPGVLASISATPTAGSATLNVSFTGNTTGTTMWSWNFGNGSSANTQNPVGTYPTGGDYVAMLTASNAFGCTASDTVHIHVDQAIALIVPNIFSPNGDNINDEFGFTAHGITELTCEIFNRWGQKVKTLSGPTAKWDGKLDNGNLASEGTYFYTVVASSYDGKPHNSQGTITIVK